MDKCKNGGMDKFYFLMSASVGLQSISVCSNVCKFVVHKASL